MSDVFTITVDVPPGTYPSVNHTHADSHRGGKKSDAYHELDSAVQREAWDYMAKTGWTTSTYYCQGAIIRYHPHKRELDPSNLGKCEFDALERAGVVEKDRLIKPVLKDAQYDPNGRDRVVIVLWRLFPSMLDLVLAPKVEVPLKAVREVLRPKVVIGAQVPLLGGIEITMKDALTRIRKGRHA